MGKQSVADPKISSITADLTDQFVKELQSQIAKQVQADVAHKLAQIDIQQTVRQFVNQALTGIIKDIKFPPQSIPMDAINSTDLRVSGNQVIAGLIKQFSSTGIQDAATQTQVTILDGATVFENKLVAPAVEIKGDLTIDGDLILTGEIPIDSPFYKDLVEHSAGLLKLSMDGQYFLQYADKVFEKIKAEGIDLAKLTINGQEILSGNKLGYFVTETNIQTLGELKSLRVNGEASLNHGTLSVLNKRVGINTDSPAGALSVWDEECEVVVRKLRKDVSIIGSMRPQKVVLSSAGKNNLVLDPDGTVAIEKLYVGAVLCSSSPVPPMYDAKKGSIVFNEQPDLGTAVGWVSMGGARWAPFGIINQ
jgi:hypothetical protein